MAISTVIYSKQAIALLTVSAIDGSWCITLGAICIVSAMLANDQSYVTIEFSQFIGFLNQGFLPLVY